MRPPKPFKVNPKRGFSLCIGCEKWHRGNNIFQHEGRLWNLCIGCWCDYWENTDVLLPDYKGFNV